MPTARLDIEYDGAGFRGWAAQPGLRTVQGELEAALATALREPVELTVAGRTDTGVHALGQVASFVTTAEAPADLARRLNGVGPDDVAVTGAAVVADGFDARRDATSRTYRYRVLARPSPSPFERGRALWWPHRLDRDALDACSAALAGSHDFTAFTPTQTDHVRFDRDILAAGWEAEPGTGAGAGAGGEKKARQGAGTKARQGAGTKAGVEGGGAGAAANPAALLAFRITADAFMRNMVRVLVGTMLEVASARRTLDDFTQLLEGAPRSAAGDTAPPHGLYLESVSYAHPTLTPP